MAISGEPTSVKEATFDDFCKRTPSFEGDLDVGVELDIFVNTFGVDVLRNGGLLFTSHGSGKAVEVFGEVVFSVNASEEEVIESGGVVRFGSPKAASRSATVSL